MYTAQILTLLASLALSRSQKFDIYGRPKCCSDSLSPLFHQQFWQDTLREATYQSIIRHLDFSGTLDGRLDRDQKLWRHLREARYIIDENPSLENIAEEIRSGFLVVRSQSSTKPNFEFHQTDKPTLECFRHQCNENNSLLALWRVRRTDNPYTLWIRVKLPTVAGSQTEDMYEYNTKYGLKKLNPDPFEYKSLKGQKGHRFSIQPKKKGDFKGIDRMDFRFPGLNKGFGIGRIMPTSILYSSPIKSGKNENGWVISPPRKPHPGIIVETGQRKPPSVPNFDHLSGPFVTSGPHGFHHIIHSLPSISPPQNLDHPTQEYRGFLPSIGPISPPPPYRTEYSYDPRYVLYYKQPNTVNHHTTTTTTKNFKPSTEFVKYSELDPFYHPEGEPGLMHTSPMPEFPHEHFHNTKLNPPNSINEQLPMNSPIGNTDPSFQIIVGDFNPIEDTTTESSSPASIPPMQAVTVTPRPPIKIQTKPTPGVGLRPTYKVPMTTTTKIPQITTKKIPSTTEIPQTILFQKIPTKAPENPETENEETTIKAFGEKIKPKTPATPKHNQTKESTTEYQKEIFGLKTQKGNKKPSIEEQLNNNINLKNEATQSNTEGMEEIETAGLFTEFTTEDDQIRSSFMGFEITTENASDEEKMTNTYFHELNKNPKDILATFNSTGVTVSEFELMETEVNTNTSGTETEHLQTDPALNDYFTEDITEVNNETTTDNFQSSDDSDFFSSLTNSFFAIETTTEKTTGRKNETSTEKQIPQNTDAETQESKQQKIQYRLLTFPGDSVSIVANRISKTVSFKTAAGKEGKLLAKPLITSRHSFSDVYKDYSTIL